MITTNPSTSAGPETSQSMSLTVLSLEDIPPSHLQESRQLIESIRETSDCNTLYYKCYQLLRLGNLAAEIPRLVVFGQQSMGKTTLLDYIMGGPIGYSSTDTGTKQPVVIILRPSDSKVIECIFDGQRMTLSMLQDAMAAKMKATGDGISTTEIEVEMLLPGGVHAVFVDLPGIKDDSKLGADLTRSVVRNYVRNNPNDLYLLVKKASDDPANWPWSLREFILSSAPKGLGLSRKQTICVGTRAKEFISNEKNDIRHQQELLKRVKKRTVMDSSGEAISLYLLELFSLPLQLKDSSDFISKKQVMREQIKEGQAEIWEILSTSFEQCHSPKIRQQLMDFFDITKFKQELNLKFQQFLNEQLGVLERNLSRKILDTQKRIALLKEKIADRTPNTCREHIKLFIRELLQLITELLSGNYAVMRLPENGRRFLAEYGGSLYDNLTEGNQMALELFADSEQYNSKLFDKTMQADADKTSNLNITWRPGQVVRFQLSKDESYMFGIIENVVKSTDASNSNVAKGVTVTFFVKDSGPSAVETGQTKTVSEDRLTVLRSLSTAQVSPISSKNKLECWHKSVRNDGWVGLTPVEVSMDDLAFLRSVKEVNVKVLESQSSSFNPNEYVIFLAAVKDLYMDAGTGEEALVGDQSRATTTFNQHSSTHRKVKLLNQISLTYLAQWMKYEISNMEPDHRFSEQVLLQMMRSVHRVIDKSEWEPLVADLLQANIRDGILHLTKLVCCAAAVALRRVLKAAVAQVSRHINLGDSSSGLLYLVQNSRFMEEIDNNLEEYCKKKALDCMTAMQDLLFEQTYAIRFEIIEDLFEGCRKYENEFLRSHQMDEVMTSIKESLRDRQANLNLMERKGIMNDDASYEQIYTEVRMQFWVAKTLLSGLLSTKIYIYFVKDVVDKGPHLASDRNIGMVCESELENLLQMALLGERTYTDQYVPLQDDALMDYYGLSHDVIYLEKQLAALERMEAYIRITLEAIHKLRMQIHREGGNVSESLPNNSSNVGPTAILSNSLESEIASQNGVLFHQSMIKSPGTPNDGYPLKQHEENDLLSEL
ncbi:arginyl-tRna synthetase [Cardiosporidium cionae]|uniref:Arginyl-tRna synthetase n=1 Tax=Cardiosporidium cionae TaxID=476202 RepID=A0ABQ7JFD0_9APIC|nr:arginyl-tRna synthetase [Cardiosporidium cionae]|eukprot:KAF8822727.1 arginyl-tRna synthetase [Cardiosporidium cionae]